MRSKTHASSHCAASDPVCVFFCTTFTAHLTSRHAPVAALLGAGRSALDLIRAGCRGQGAVTTLPQSRAGSEIKRKKISAE